jgi:tetratricopeptide (TPR) repeat protein
MQLDLFEDNRSGILTNIANECILAGDLAQAASVYEQILVDSSGDTYTSILLTLVTEWRDLLAGIDTSTSIQEYLNMIWIRFQNLSHPALRSAVLGTLIDAVRALSDPEQLFIPPRFHLGQVLMAAKRHDEAAESFRVALANSDLERGRFLSWRGDALTLAGNMEDSLKSYLAAFLDDPHSVDKYVIKNRKIAHLLSTLHLDTMDEIDVAEEAAWLPVWGWLQGVFSLPLQSAPEKALSTAGEFELLIAEKRCSIARIWFDMLVLAERLRVTPSENQELVALRRLMKNSHGFMFGQYLEKIGGRKSQ